jgi:hypothetical protein
LQGCLPARWVVAGHHRYVNLFIDGIHGAPTTTEKEQRLYNDGGDKGDYDVWSMLKNGTQTAYNNMLTAANAGLATNANYEAMK